MKIITFFILTAISSTAISANVKVPSSIELNVQSILQEDPWKSLKKKGCKVYITGNDANAQIHLRRELEFYDVWVIKLNESEADFEIKLLTKKSGIANADRDVRIVITELKSGTEVYSSDVVNGTEYGFKTVNLKEAAVKNLVENVIRPKFFE